MGDIGRIKTALERATGASSDFDLNPEVKLAAGRKLRSAGVLVPLIREGTETRVILTKRASTLKHHPGQIAFPGGKVDPSDDGPIAAALREADEEIGLAPTNTEVLGVLPCHETVTAFQVTPVLAQVTGAFVPRPEPGEVEEVFSVPLSHVSDPANFGIESRYWRGQRRYYYVVPFGPYYIWGATARILRGLAHRMEP